MRKESGLVPRAASQSAGVAQTVLAPLMAMLTRELHPGNVPAAQPSVNSLGEFTEYYLQVLQQLENQIANSDGRQPMSRSEVEALCRCALSANTLGEAIALCEQFCTMLHPRAGEVGLQVRGDTATFFLKSLRSETTSASILVDITGLFAFRQLLQWLVGVDLPLRQVGVCAVQRDDVLALLQLFKAPVLTGKARYKLEFGRSALDLPVVRNRQEFSAFFEVFPCGVFELTVSRLSEQVAMLLDAAARQGGGLPKQAQLAEHLDMPLSSFRRRLAAEGSAFKTIRNRVLCELSLELLQRGDMSVNDIAVQLGFTDAASFRRAFVRWTGETPGRWANAQQG